MPSKRHKYAAENEAETANAVTFNTSSKVGGALGPDWHSSIQVKGCHWESKRIKIEYEVELKRVLTREEFDAAKSNLKLAVSDFNEEQKDEVKKVI